MLKKVSTNKAPGAIGPYSQAIIYENLLFTSGQIPLNPESGELETDIKKATKRSMENIKGILEEAGTSLEITVFKQSWHTIAVCPPSVHVGASTTSSP